MVKLNGSHTKTNLLGVWVSKQSVEEVLAHIGSEIALKTKPVFDYANVHTLNTAYTTPWLKDFYNQCEVVFCDGVGVRLAAWLLGKPIPERFSPPDWIVQLGAQCADSDKTMFFIGGKDGVAQKAANVLMEATPGLRIAGTHHGYFDKSKGSLENQRVLERINQAGPDILVVGFGIPIQERWILENRSDLQVGVFLAAGALFDYIAGEMWRGPKWMTDNGLEWLGRLVTEPRRLWRRYLIGIPVFFTRVLRQKFGLLPAEEVET
jgi:N-acetylglucosaminyldiphosphoundecaprenol N-acetyl-beta-D-mannosaminyltransferase